MENTMSIDVIINICHNKFKFTITCNFKLDILGILANFYLVDYVKPARLVGQNCHRLLVKVCGITSIAFSILQPFVK